MYYRSSLHSYVDAYACADDVQLIKPHPDMVLSICSRTRVLPQETVMVGDNSVDVEMGNRAGVALTVGVLSGLGDAETLAKHADLVLNSVDEIFM